MTTLERAVSGSGHIAFSMKFSQDFPTEIISGKNPFGGSVKMSEIIHPDDYQPFCEVINSVISGAAEDIEVHARLLTEGEHSWFYITGRADRSTALGSIDGMMFNVSAYLDCEGEDAVMRRFKNKHTAAIGSAKLGYGLKDILGESYLVRIQKPFDSIKGLFSAIIDTEGRVIAQPDGQSKKLNIGKFSYQRPRDILVRHQTIAKWVIASDDSELISQNLQLLETMADTVAGVANSYVVLVDEMENSQNANKLLGQNFEDQILVNNIYSLILQSPDTAESISGILPLVSEYFGLSDIVFCSEMSDPVQVYRWDKSGILLPVVCETPSIPALAEELDYSGIVCTDRRTMTVDHDGKNLSCAMVRTYNKGKARGVMLYTADRPDRVWTNRDRKVLKNVTQILSTVINRIFIENELATSRARLERLAYYDRATNIPNRSLFESDFRAETETGGSGAVIALEISNLKAVSEIYSCEYADEVLKSIAEYVSAIPCSAKVKVYRFSNDILFITMSGADREEARQFAQVILTKYRSPWYLNGSEHHLQVYSGVTIYPSDAANIDNCISAVTQTLRLAKERDLDDAACYSEGLEEKLGDNMLVKKLITDAAENDFKGFYFLYQPVIEISTGELHCCEANLYWGNEEMSIPRDRFMPIIDSLGLSKQMYRFAVDKICALCATVRDAGIEGFRVSFAIPESIMNTESTIDALRSALLEYALPPSAVSISVSEGERTLYGGNMFLQQMSKIGVNIIADDLGDSYFTTAPLENPAVKTVKLRAERFTDDVISGAYIRSVIKLAHEKGIAVCARDVDSPAEFTALKGFDVDLVEGVFNGRPLRDSEFIDKLVTVH